MEVRDKMKDLNMTADEIDRLKKAFKDEKFREMLRDYAQELSDPENKKRYEEEIKLLEQERGHTVEFIHPEPFKALRTSVNGKQKCFINICANEKVGKPECKWGESEDGRRGQCWSLPHSLHPGRQDTDPKGNKIIIYDVIFHPDTLHIASKNKGFMDMVEGTAIQGIQDGFKVTLDKNNVRQMSTKYKGTPQPCVIRKPIPGYKAKEHSDDPLAFPYPDEKRPTSLQTQPTESTKNSSIAKSQSFSMKPQKEPTKPNYTVKYRSFVDLQDFRYSRDSAQSPRPKEIVVTIDMPLLKAAADASLEVKERRLLLESKKPAYKLELPLAYPVDEDKGEAKFNKQRGQLTVTLPVLPSNEAFDFSLRPAETSVGDDDEQQGKRDVEGDLRQQTEVEKGGEEVERGPEKGEEQVRESQEGSVGETETWRKQKEEGENKEEDEIGVEEENLKEQKNEKEVDNPQNRQQHEDKNDSGVTSLQCDTADVSVKEESSLPVNNRLVDSPETESRPVLIIADQPTCEGKEDHSCLESTPEISDFKDETEQTRESAHGKEKVTGTDALHQRSRDESQTCISASSQNTKDCNIQESSEMPATDEANKSSRGGLSNRVALCSEERRGGSVKQEDVDEDDLLIQQIFHNTGHNNKPPPVLLREIDKDGNETVISNHFTSAAFILQNSLMYELD
ncbi:LOW QUALITY PROTEIN: protein kintoun [Plectropomus leopardus]|uniref:LOW QUALITY PROTEIN: protein kintoun n=1 Tax=Plectropomus leopardus TaxID=160734 RepID=UPI001C4DD2E3|nr:LOW QUALITY PROTEIN: protein kintoun [Plectropomus leopardus]